MTAADAVARQAAHENITKELIEALEALVGWMPGPAAWHTDAPTKAVERARAVLAKASIVA